MTKYTVHKENPPKKGKKTIFNLRLSDTGYVDPSTEPSDWGNVEYLGKNNSLPKGSQDQFLVWDDYKDKKWIMLGEKGDEFD